MQTACDALASLSKPTVVVVRGYCIGGGFELAVHADIRIGDETTKIGLPAAKRGIAIGHKFVSRIKDLVGASNTSYLLLSARLMNAEEAYNAGLLSVVSRADHLDDVVGDLIKDLAETSPVSHRIHKEVIADLHAHGSMELIPPGKLALPSNAEDSADFREGVQSFMDKRKPHFPGY